MQVRKVSFFSFYHSDAFVRRGDAEIVRGVILALRPWGLVVLLEKF